MSVMSMSELLAEIRTEEPGVEWREDLETLVARVGRVAAFCEEERKHLRSIAPEAILALLNGDRR